MFGPPRAAVSPSTFAKRAVLVAALGYFVDIFDLFLFSVLRSPSLADLGVPASQSMATGSQLLNWQMAGLLFGSVAWGVLGDRQGRQRALYGSILVYSLATLANGLVSSLPGYLCCRLVAGLGLGGELGAAVTLVSELLPTARRGLGTMVVAGCGLCGGIAAAGLAEKIPWRSCYAIGGGLGLLLLLLRTRTLESPLFLRRAAPGSRSQRGDLRLLLCSRRRRQIYLRLVLTGVPIWFVAGILMVFAPEFGRALGIAGITAPRAVLSSYLGVASGDFLSGLLSQLLRSRKWAIGSFLALLAVGMGGFLGARGVSPQRFYAICFALGIGTGYWAVLVTTAAEHFGTNLRATVATTVPNLIRAAVIPLSFGRQLIERSSDRLLGQPLGLVGQSVLLGGLVLLLALWALAGLDETFGRSLDFDEQC